MLVFALEQEESPSTVLEATKKINWKEASLREWAIILENIGHFLEQFKKERIQTENVNFCTLLDHAILYYKILNQTDRSTDYRSKMLDTMTKFTQEEKFSPTFPDVISFGVKEMLCQLINPNSVQDTLEEETGEQNALESKIEGDFYLELEKFPLALDAYNTAIRSHPSKVLNYIIRQNMCQALNGLENLTSCINQAKSILSEYPDDPGAYGWLSLSYSKAVKKDEHETERHLRNELSSVFAALSWFFSNHDIEVAKRLKSKNISFSTDVVKVVDCSPWLQKALEDSRSLLYKRNGVRNVILLRPGTYKIHPLFWQEINNVCLLGLSTIDGKKPTILIDTPIPAIQFKNSFINIHFKIDAGHITAGPQNGVCLFLDCTFVSNSPNLSERDVAEVKDDWERYAKKIRESRNMSVEEYEEKQVSDEEQNANKKAQWREDNDRAKNAHPAVVAVRGICVMVNCDMLDCLGAGALVMWPDNQTEIVTPPWLYMKGCTMRNCGFAGAEAREEGNLVLESCTISDCTQGVLVWMDAHEVVVRRSDIYNSKLEGVLVTDPDLNYNNSMRVKFEENFIHHNQIGMSLSHVRSVDITGNQIFSNRSWGIFLRNSNVTTVQRNNIFRNDCGGLRVCLNRFDRTIVMKNNIHDHTGPGLCQTSFFSESQEQILTTCQNRIARSSLQ